VGTTGRIVDYDYSYCRVNTAYFTDFVLDSHTKQRDT